MSTDKTGRVLLIVDDDELFCDATAAYLEDEGVEIVIRHTGSGGLEVCRDRRVDVVLLDQNLPDAEGHGLCPAILGENEHAKIVFVTAHPSFDTAVEALRAGAHDYLSKPFEAEQLRLAVRQAFRAIDLDQLEDVERYRHEKTGEQVRLVGESESTGHVRELVALASSSDAPVLITGETGSGKTHVARAIHYTGPLRRRTFISTNCAALPETLIEAELFGNEKGAFTGAGTSRQGIFEMAQGGTLFLDEIGEMSPNLQSKLLGVLEDGQLRRIGGSRVISVDARVVAATSRDIESSLGDGFRSDLYYRLSVIRIHVPPLRDRRDDIPVLARHLLADLAGRDVGLTRDEEARLSGYDWPGNVRELRNVLERAVILQLGTGRSLRPSDLIEHGRPSSPSVPPPTPVPAADRSLEDVEREHVVRVLEAQDGNLTRTAKVLGIALSTLKRKLRRHGLR